VGKQVIIATGGEGHAVTAFDRATGEPKWTSGDDSVAQIGRAFPDIPVIVNHANLGYAEGNNVGIRWALERGADYVMLLNDDALVEPDTFYHLVRAVSPPDVGAVGCKVRVYETPQRLWAAGRCFPRGEYPLDDGRFDSPGEVDYVVGCCILLSRQALESVGLLDDKLFAIYEETEWCLRARQAGYRILYAPQAIVYHKLSASLSNNWSPAYHYLYTRNYLYYWERLGIIPPNWRCLRGVFLVWREEIGFIFQKGEDKLRRMLAVTRGAYDYLRKRFGPPPDNL